MENSNITLNKEEYCYNIDSNTNKLIINVVDNSALTVTGVGCWYNYKVVGNEITFIIDRNLSTIDREADIRIQSSMYPDRYAYIAITQKGEEYSLESDIYTKNDMSPLIEGESFTFNLTAKGGRKQCLVKDIKEYRKIDDYTDEYIRIPFDNSLTTEIKQNNDNDESYTLTIYNLGKLTENVSYFEIIVIHCDNPSTELKIHLRYKELSDGINVLPTSLEFKSNGYSSNSIIKLNGNHLSNIEENVINNNEWVHLACGYDCIYVYVDINDNSTNRKGEITIYGNNVTINQSGKTISNNINLMKLDNNVEIPMVFALKNTYMEGIELVSIEDNIIKLRTNTLEGDKYVHDSMITVNMTGKWADFSLDYDAKDEIHIINVIVKNNPFGSERKCSIIIRNAEDTKSIKRFLLTQEPLSDRFKLDIN